MPTVADMGTHTPTVLFVPEYDAAHMEIGQYAQNLQQNGAQVTVIEGAGMVHGCIKAMRISPAVKDAYQEIIAASLKLLQQAHA